ncbi:SusC/RagA family TonB-linked outer membrane protein [Chitinophaga sp. 22321]|uniref:SusC/RagA family TonB-linked outer membrane protein n=1 Tax=Chitinophaga hostae TaxID=2831022 RepID=A0ABS5IYK1_9BACT|nr:SusC/RagA family TonB-linked outer membrane protein [Chitinophaga hostae]MBS0028036.1 SusC/RagA family TonB-linked outer membrane protein [Chitinophaga hostae]
MNQAKSLLWAIALLCIMLQSTRIYSQNRINVKGVITDSTGAPLPGATISQEGNLKNGTISAPDGHFELNAPPGSRLKITMTGFNTAFAVSGNAELKIKLHASTTDLTDVIVVGYGTQKRTKMTSAVSSMNAKDIQLIPATNLSNVLAGRLSGTFISSPTGTPGIGSNVKVRSRSSFSNSAVEPLYVIDGVVRDKVSFDALDPNEVADITILKDASSAAIYGSRSSNGAILVTTKTGRSGAAVINFNTTYNTMRTGKLPEYMPVKDGLNLSKAVNGGLSDEEIDWVLKNNPNGDNYYKAAYHNPSSQRYALSVSGGSEKITGYIGGSYVKEDGFLPQVSYKKYNLRGNVQANLVKNLTLGLNMGTSYGTRSRFNFTYDYGSDDLNNLWGKLLYWDVFATPYINGKPNNPGWLGNPIEMMKNGGYWRNNNQQIDALVTAEYKIPAVEGLSIKGTYSKNFDNSYIKTFAKKQTLYNFKKSGPNGLIYTDEMTGTTMSGDPGSEYLGNEYNKSNTYQLNAQINYDRTFGKHTIGALAVYEQYEGFGNNFRLYRYNFPLVATDQFLYTSGNNADWSTGGGESQIGRMSYIGRFNYDYDAKYLFSASVRRDGSTNFAPNKRWGWFPSVSAGWVVSKEGFFQSSGLGHAVDFLKLRGSYATTGNDILDKDDPNSRWRWMEQYIIQGGTYFMGASGVTAPRLAYGGLPNSNLTWEKSNTAGFGIDATVYKNIRFTFDYWKRKSYDILGTRILAIPSEFGASLPPENYGKVDSKGIEIELGYSNSIGRNFSYNVKGVFTYATNKAIKRDVAANTQDYANPIGKTLAYGYGYKALGVIKTQDELNKLPAGYTINGVAPALGDMLLADLSGPDGKPDNKVDSYDQMVLGNYFGADNAPMAYGLNISLTYKGFSVEALFSGLTGYKIGYSDPWGRNFGGGGKVPAFHADSWSTDNPDGSSPKMYPWGDPHSAGYTWSSNYTTFNGGFLRMKYLNLAYRLPDIILNRLALKDTRIFLSGSNLFNISKFKLYDPEVAGFMSYPTMKTFTAGIDIRL